MLTTRNTSNRFCTARCSALLAVAVLFAGCETDETKSRTTAASETKRTTNTDPNDPSGDTPQKPAPEQSPAERRAERAEPPPSGALDEPGSRSPSQPGATSPTPGQPSGTQPSHGMDQHAMQMQVMEKSATGDIQGFEKRLKAELEKDDMQLAAAVDLEDEPKMRLLVIAPKKGEIMAAMNQMEGSGSMKPGSDEMEGSDSMKGTRPEPMPGSGSTPSEGSMPESGTTPPSPSAPGTTPTPGAGSTPTPTPTPGSGSTPSDDPSEKVMTSATAQAALEQVLVLVAYTEPGDTDRVRLAYFEHPQGHDMSTIDAAIDRAAQDMASAPAG